MSEDTSSAPNGVGAPPVEKEEKEGAGESRIYEIGYLVVPTVSEEELPREVTALKDMLDKEKAVIIAEEFPKLRPLAYPMQKRIVGGYQKHLNGYFGWVKFEVPTGSAKTIEQELKRNEKLLRYILIKTVREHTLTQGRPVRTFRTEKKEAPKDAPASAPVSEVELDKSIEKLIAE